MTTDYQPSDPVMFNLESQTDIILSAYYVRYRNPVHAILPQDTLYYLYTPSMETLAQAALDPSMNTIPIEQSGTAQQELNSYFENNERVWLYQNQSQHLSSVLTPSILQQYGAARYMHYDRLEAFLFTSVPDNVTDYWFGDHLQLVWWGLANENNVTPCQDVTLISWWRTEQQLEDKHLFKFEAIESGTPLTREDDTLGFDSSQYWYTDTMYRDVSQVTIPCETTPGNYDILISMYAEPNDFKPVVTPLNIYANDDQRTPLGQDFLYLTTLHVSE